MIPLRDLNPSRTKPAITYAFIAANVLVFLYQLVLPEKMESEFVLQFGAVPYRFLDGDPGAWLTPLTSMFMHGGLLHIASNMWFLHVFGDNVEDALGRGRYVFFYLLAGLGAVAAQVGLTFLLAGFDVPVSRADPRLVPMVGASGAIAGVLGAYVRLYPRARVLTLVPLFILVQLMEVPATVFIFVWAGLQLLGTLQSLGGMGGGGVAFAAHVGGFVVGFLVIRVLVPKVRVHRGPSRVIPRNVRVGRLDDDNA